MMAISTVQVSDFIQTFLAMQQTLSKRNYTRYSKYSTSGNHATEHAHPFPILAEKLLFLTPSSKFKLLKLDVLEPVSVDTIDLAVQASRAALTTNGFTFTSFKLELETRFEE